MYAPKKILLSRIEVLRNKMTEVAWDKGFTSEESLHVSQELDELLNVYHCLDINTRNEVDLARSYKQNIKITT